MAIKGKGRSKRRGVASAPKPVYVKPKVPLLARRGFQVGVLVVIGVGAIVGVIIGLIVQHNNNEKAALEAQEKSIVQRFGRSMDDSLTGVGQPFQTQFQPFPDLTSDVTKLKSGELSDEDAVKEAEKWAKAAASAEQAVQAIPVANLIEGHPALIDL